MTARVLIVDDDPVVRETLTLALEDERWEVTTVASAEDAMTRWQAGAWAALVVDKNLPGMSGVDLIRAVRADDDAVGILLITGYSSVQTALDTLHLGIDGYLEKPFDDIFAVVRDVADAVEAQEGRRRAGSMAGAFSHFARATEHLRAIPRDRGLRVLLGASLDTAAWIQARLGVAEVEVVATREEVLACLSQPWDLMFLEVALASDAVAWVRDVRALAGDVACVVVSVRPTFEMVTQLIRLRVRAVLEQPFSERQFDLRIVPLLDRLRARGELTGEPR